MVEARAKGGNQRLPKSLPPGPLSRQRPATKARDRTELPSLSVLPNQNRSLTPKLCPEVARPRRKKVARNPPRAKGRMLRPKPCRSRSPDVPLRRTWAKAEKPIRPPFRTSGPNKSPVVPPWKARAGNPNCPPFRTSNPNRFPLSRNLVVPPLKGWARAGKPTPPPFRISGPNRLHRSSRNPVVPPWKEEAERPKHPKFRTSGPNRLHHSSRNPVVPPWKEREGHPRHPRFRTSGPSRLRRSSNLIDLRGKAEASGQRLRFLRHRRSFLKPLRRLLKQIGPSPKTEARARERTKIQGAKRGTEGERGEGSQAAARVRNRPDYSTSIRHQRSGPGCNTLVRSNSDSMVQEV